MMIRILIPVVILLSVVLLYFGYKLKKFKKTLWWIAFGVVVAIIVPKLALELFPGHPVTIAITEFVQK